MTWGKDSVDLSDRRDYSSLSQGRGFENFVSFVSMNIQILKQFIVLFMNHF